MSGGPPILNFPHSPSSTARGASTSRLLALKLIDEPDDLDKSWSDHFKMLSEMIEQSSEREINNKLQDQASDIKQHAAITMGLLYGIITEPDKAQMYFQYLSFVMRDNFAFAVSQLKTLIKEKFPKLLDHCRQQVVWLVSELATLNIPDVESLCMLLLRQAPTGDITPRNLALISGTLKILDANRDWLYQYPKLISTAAYTYLRFITDHNKPHLAGLRQQEINFCSTIIRQRFADVASIGRDFIRLLYEVRQVPEFDKIWASLTSNPQELGAEPGALQSILLSTTKPRYPQSRITFDMEKQLTFVMTEVKMGNQRRYQQWFAQRYLNALESENLIPDIIRYICAVFHPPNQIIASNFVPRWAMIGWLLKAIKSPSVLHSARVALFFDWVFYNNESVMNLEPAVLLLVHSIPKYLDITSSLLAFLFNFDNFPHHGKDSREGFNFILPCLQKAFACVVEKGVIGSLAPLSECPQLDNGIRDKLKKYFPNQIRPIVPPPGHQPQQPHPPQQLHPTYPGSMPVSPKTAPSLPGPMPVSPKEAPPAENKQAPPATERHERPPQSTIVKQEQPPTQQQASKQQEAAYAKAATDSASQSIKSLTGVPASLGGFEPFLTKFSKTALESDAKARAALEKIIDHFEKMDVVDNTTINDLALFLMRVLAFEFNKITFATLPAAPATTTKKKPKVRVPGTNEDEEEYAFGDDDDESQNKESQAATTAAESSFLRQLVSGPKQSLLDALLDMVYSRIVAARQASRNAAAQAQQQQQQQQASTAAANTTLSLKRPSRAVNKGAEINRTVKRLRHLLRAASMQEPALGYRILLFCIKKERLLDTNELLLSLTYTEKNTRPKLPILSDEPKKKKSVASNREPNKKGTKFWFYFWFANESFQFKPSSAAQASGSQSSASGEHRLGEDKERSALIQDIQRCGEDSGAVLNLIVPVLCKYVPEYTVGNPDFIRNIVANVLPSQLQDILYLCSVNRVEVLGSEMETILDIIETSLTWDSFEQNSLWDIIVNEVLAKAEFDFPKMMRQIFELPTFNPKEHVEFSVKLLNLVKVYEPNYEMIKFVITLPPSLYGRFPSTLIANWLRIYKETSIKAMNKLMKELSALSPSTMSASSKSRLDNTIVNLVQIKYAEENAEREEEEEQSGKRGDQYLFESSKFLGILARLKERGLIKPHIYDILIRKDDEEDEGETDDDEGEAVASSSSTTTATTSSSTTATRGSAKRGGSSSSSGDDDDEDNNNSSTRSRGRSRRGANSNTIDDDDDDDEPQMQRRRKRSAKFIDDDDDDEQDNNNNNSSSSSSRSNNNNSSLKRGRRAEEDDDDDDDDDDDKEFRASESSDDNNEGSEEEGEDESMEDEDEDNDENGGGTSPSTRRSTRAQQQQQPQPQQQREKRRRLRHVKL